MISFIFFVIKIGKEKELIFKLGVLDDIEFFRIVFDIVKIWRFFGLVLGLGNFYLDEIGEDYWKVLDRVYVMLRKWKELMGFEVNYERLV